MVNFINWFAEYNVIPKGMALKLSLLNNQSKKSFGFVKKDDLLINKYLRIRNLNCKIIKVNT